MSQQANGTAHGQIEKVSIIVSKGSLEGVYPGLIMANGARMEGIEANLFFTFFGLDAISRAKHEHVKVATVGNPGLHLATWAGGIPGVSALVTHKLAQEMERLDIPPIPEFVELIAESGAGLYACQASVDLFGLTGEDFVPEVEGVITVGEFYALAAGGQIVFSSESGHPSAASPRGSDDEHRVDSWTDAQDRVSPGTTRRP